eukprot:2218305-Rhodomonas_salina.1
MVKGAGGTGRVGRKKAREQAEALKADLAERRAALDRLPPPQPDGSLRLNRSPQPRPHSPLSLLLSLSLSLPLSLFLARSLARSLAVLG